MQCMRETRTGVRRVLLSNATVRFPHDGRRSSSSKIYFTLNSTVRVVRRVESSNLSLDVTRDLNTKGLRLNCKLPSRQEIKFSTIVGSDFCCRSRMVPMNIEVLRNKGETCSDRFFFFLFFTTSQIETDRLFGEEGGNAIVIGVEGPADLREGFLSSGTIRSRFQLSGGQSISSIGIRRRVSRIVCFRRDRRVVASFIGTTIIELKFDIVFLSRGNFHQIGKDLTIIAYLCLRSAPCTCVLAFRCI